MKELTSEKENNTNSPNVFNQAVWVVVGKIILVGVYVLISIVLVKSLGKEKYGVYSLCKAFAEYLVPICALGLNTALIRFIPELIHSDNYSGFKKLIWKSATLQVGMVLLIGSIFIYLSPLVDGLFNVTFGINIFLTVLLVFGTLSKEFITSIFTAIFKLKVIVVSSVVQGVLWLGLLWYLLASTPEVSTVLLSQSATLLVTTLVTCGILVQYIYNFPPHPSLPGIGRLRTLQLSLATCANTVFRMLMNRYTELFFLGVYYTPSDVAVYHLGFSMTAFAISLIPASLQKLFLSSFCDAFVKKPDRLPELTSSLYKMLAVFVVPVSAFGFFFCPQMFLLLYGPEMSDAGYVGAAFCIVHLLPYFSIPLSMAVVASEKVIKTTPLLVFQITVNLILDWLLIPQYGIPGAIAAVPLTFFLTVPVRVYVIRKIIGGVFFPYRFILKSFVIFYLLAGVLAWLSPQQTFYDLTFSIFLYGAGVAGVLILSGLISEREMESIRSLENNKLNQFIDWVIKIRLSLEQKR